MITHLVSPPKTPLKFLWSIIKPYKWWYALILQAPLLTAFYFFANNYSLKLLVDDFSSEHIYSYYQLLFPIVLFISAQIFADVIWRLSNFAEWKAEPYVRQDLLLTTYNYVQYHSYRYFQNTPSGSIISKIKGLLDGYDKIFANLHHVIGKQFCTVVVSIFLLLIVNTTVFIFMLGWCLLFLTILIPMGLKLNQLSHSTAESKHKVIGFFADNITNIFSLFSFSKRQSELKRVGRLIENDFIPRQINMYRYDFKFHIIGGFLYWIMLMTIFMFMIHLRKNAAISTGDFLFVMLTTITVSFELWGFMTSLCNFLEEVGDFKASFEVLASTHENIDALNAKDLTITRGKIDFKNISFGYEKNIHVFSNLNLSINPGEKIGLVGHSGAGKTTLISLFLKNFKPNLGNIFIDDQPIDQITTDSLREQVALIPQDILLFHRSIAENIGYAKENATMEEIQLAATIANINDFIESLPEKYNTLVGERGIKLSMGQRQRVAIARAFLKNAPIIILDEATSSLDTLSEQKIQKSIDRILEQKKSTVIVIAHRLSTIRHMDRIIVMEKGTIVEEGSFQELVNDKKSYFKQLWDSQTEGII